MKLLKTALVLGLMFQSAPAEAQEVPAPTVPPTVGCNTEGCMFSTPEGVVHAGYRYQASSAPGAFASVGWWDHWSEQPPGTFWIGWLCNGEAPYSDEECGPPSLVYRVPVQPQTPVGIITQVFGGRASEAIAVAQCESGLNPGARSPGGGNHGLFQINNVHQGSFTRVTGQPWSAVYDAYHNATFAKWLYDGQGWRPWTCQP